MSSVPIYGKSVTSNNLINPLLVKELETLTSYLATMTTIMTTLTQTKNIQGSKQSMDILINKIQTDFTTLCP